MSSSLSMALVSNSLGASIIPRILDLFFEAEADEFSSGKVKGYLVTKSRSTKATPSMNNNKSNANDRTNLCAMCIWILLDLFPTTSELVEASEFRENRRIEVIAVSKFIRNY
ncbi:unnamed protein product [Debaryomyces tyrocola]|nr:unnamed protein product [Debaryomyces tyrocola]